MPSRPSTGPGSNSQATFAPSAVHEDVATEIATTVMKQPMLFWMASALPISSGGQARA